jgi:hypothetical protein
VALDLAKWNHFFAELAIISLILILQQVQEGKGDTNAGFADAQNARRLAETRASRPKWVPPTGQRYRAFEDVGNVFVECSRVFKANHLPGISAVRQSQVLAQTTLIGVKPTRTASEPSCPWLNRTYFSTSSPEAITSGSRFIFARTQISEPLQRLPAV